LLLTNFTTPPLCLCATFSTTEAFLRISEADEFFFAVLAGADIAFTHFFLIVIGRTAIARTELFFLSPVRVEQLFSAVSTHIGRRRISF
jgi:hypothetical protein